MVFCHCVFFGVHVNCEGLCSNKHTGHICIPSCCERLSVRSTLTCIWISSRILVESMSSHLGPDELASVPWAGSRTESPFHSSRIHTCIHNVDTYVLPLLPVCQMFLDKYHTALGDGWSCNVHLPPFDYQSSEDTSRMGIFICCWHIYVSVCILPSQMFSFSF